MKLKYFILGLLPFLTACSIEDSPIDGGEPVEIRLSASVLSVSADGSRSFGQDTQLPVGTKVGVTVTKTSDGTELYYRSMTVQSDQTLASDEPMYFPLDGTPISIKAIAPEGDYETTGVINLNLDQRTQAAYASNDICKGSLDVAAPTKSTLIIPMTHQMCKIEVVVEKGSSMADIAYIMIPNVYSTYTAPTTAANIFNPENHYQDSDNTYDIIDLSGIGAYCGSYPGTLYFSTDGSDYNEAIIGPQHFAAGEFITVVLKDGNMYSYPLMKALYISRGCSERFTVNLTNNNSVEKPEPIDLGLSVKWAPYNLGAHSAESTGYYYQWGASTPPEINSYEGEWDTFLNDNWDTLLAGNIPRSIDPATLLWGEDWRMPTEEDFKELINSSTYQATTFNGVSGYSFTVNNNTIFIPNSGYYAVTTLNNANSVYLWTSTQDTGFKGLGRYFGTRTGAPTVSNLSGWVGCPIRPVYDPVTN